LLACLGLALGDLLACLGFEAEPPTHHSAGLEVARELFRTAGDSVLLPREAGDLEALDLVGIV
jgi:hypothetical protein